MAFLPGLGKLVKKVGALSKSPVGRFIDRIGGAVVSTLPGGKQLQAGGKVLSGFLKKPVGKAATIGAVGLGGYAAAPGPMFGGGGGGVPALPGMQGGGAMMPYQGGGMVGASGQFLPPVIDASMLGTYYRAPRGYVIVRDPSGMVYGMLKPLARANRLWHASRKPPISAGDWHKYQTARAVEKRLLKIARHGLRRHHTAAPHYAPHRKGK